MKQNPAPAELLPGVDLYYRKANHDKIYFIRVEPKDGGFVVNFTYGKREGHKTAGTKTTTPVSYERALEIFDKLVEKQKNHPTTPYYELPASEAAGATPIGLAVAPPPEAVAKAVEPLLLTPVVDAEHGASFIFNDGYAAVEKFDGIRIILVGTPTSIIAYNKKGLPRSISSIVDRQARALQSSVESFKLDGELIGDQFVVFDVLELMGTDYLTDTFEHRMFVLKNLGQLISTLTAFSFAEVAFTTDEKVSLVERLHASGAEGVVFRRKEAPYRPGRQKTEFKHKFVATATFIVTGHNERRSVSLGLLDEAGEVVHVGNCSIGSNKEIPPVDSLIEVRYLYAHRGGSVSQPSFLIGRDDVDRNECTLSQLRYKNEERAAAA